MLTSCLFWVRIRVVKVPPYSHSWTTSITVLPLCYHSVLSFPCCSTNLSQLSAWCCSLQTAWVSHCCWTSVKLEKCLQCISSHKEIIWCITNLHEVNFIDSNEEIPRINTSIWVHLYFEHSHTDSQINTHTTLLEQWCQSRGLFLGNLKSWFSSTALQSYPLLFLVTKEVSLTGRRHPPSHCLFSSSKYSPLCFTPCFPAYCLSLSVGFLWGSVYSCGLKWLNRKSLTWRDWDRGKINIF